MENLRERTRRQAEDTKKFAIQGFCKDLLDVADNLGRAVSTVETDEAADAEKVKRMLTSMHEGVLLVEKQLASTFAKHGVEKFDPMGDEFDPNSHMALFNVPDADKEAGTIAAVTKPGYRLHDRVIRPAEVGVYQSP
jgi:molecular chaperone GrpE